ncbi:methyltransferase domain-containing protein [Candidatus Dependentiae bacterium]|nr:methyltransferase domain-containing protein [Candidatus Dependentiae bacterium]
MSSGDLNEGFEFWDKVGKSFIDYSTAPTTKYYFDEEITAIKKHFELSPEKTFLKLDLWNEAINTNILFEVAKSGIECFGLDISEGIVQRAYNKSRFEGVDINFVIGDIFNLPFKKNSFDYLYTMGTIEHSKNMESIVSQIYQVLKPGGKAIIGLPNRLDPFFRPLLKNIMELFNIYSFGLEKSLDVAELRNLFFKNKFRILNSGSMLFLPGILRIIDLFFFKYFRFLTKVTEILYKPFQFLKRKIPFLRLSGYLIYIVVEKKQW